MDTQTSPSHQTTFEETAHGQSIDPKTSSFADVATAEDSPETTTVQASPDDSVLSLDALLESTQPRESPSKDSSDSSPSEQRDIKEENRPSESKDEAHATFGDKVKEVSKQVVKCGQYLQEMAEQVAEWEEKIRKLVSKDNEDWKISEKRDTEDYTISEESDNDTISEKSDNEHGKTFKEDELGALPIVPTIRLVNWTDFKNISLQTPRHAIEVLVGEAKTYSQWHEHEKQNVDEGGNGDLSRGSLAGKTSPSPGAAASHRDVPNQIRINSIILIQIMSDICGENWLPEPHLMSRPYQYLAYYESYIEKVLDRLEAKWADTERDQHLQTFPYHEHSKSLFVATEKERPIAPTSAGHSEGRANVRGVPEKDEAVLGSSEKATPINDAELVNVPYEEKVNQNAKAKPSSIELVDSVEALREVRCLMEFINVYLKPYLKLFDPARNHKIQFTDLWHIFKPGDRVFAPLRAENDAEALNPQANEPDTESKASVSSRDRYQKVWRIYYTHSGPPYASPEELESMKAHSKPKPKPAPFQLRCYYLDFDGERVGPVMHNFRINAFQGEKDINSLPIYPLKYAKNAATIEDQMRKRGQMFREFSTFQHRYYIGASLVHQPSGDIMFNDDNQPMHPENIASQVIVDFSGLLQRNPEWYPNFDIGKFPARVHGEGSPKKVWKDKECRNLDHEMREMICYADSVEMKLQQDLKDRESLLKDDYDEGPTGLADLCDDDLILLPARVFAYSFRNRKFGMSSDETLPPEPSLTIGFSAVKYQQPTAGNASS